MVSVSDSGTASCPKPPHDWHIVREWGEKVVEMGREL